MCFEKTLLTAKEFGIVGHQQITLSDNNGAQHWEAVGPHGKILMSEIQDDDYCIWHIDFLMQSDTTLTIEQVPPASSVGLSFTLKRNMPYFVKGLMEGVARRNQYNLTFLPESHCEFRLKKGEYEMFGVEFNPEYLRKLSGDDSPLLQEFINSVMERRAASITETHYMATPDIMDVVSELVNFRYPGKMRKLYIKSRVVDLLRLSIENISTEKNSVNGVSTSDMKALNGVKGHLLQNLDNPGSLGEIAQRMGINEFKLKTGFRKLFGKSVIGFVRDERLRQARELITKTDLPIKVIATKAGYRSITNFTTAFRKRFGYPPGTLKRDSSNGELPG